LYNVRGKPFDTKNPITLKHGVELPYDQQRTGAPSYEREKSRRVAKAENERDYWQNAVKTYEKVIATWAPEKYPTTGAETKKPTVHMERLIPRAAGNRITTCCKGMAAKTAHLLKTNDPDNVTCKPCRKALGLPT
jgi:hypothetical protein